MDNESEVVLERYRSWNEIECALAAAFISLQNIEPEGIMCVIEMIAVVDKGKNKC